MINIKNLIIQILILIAFQTICFQLLLDPWAAERFERLWRENARLFNPLLSLNSRIDPIREIIAISGIVFSLLHFLGSKFFGQVSCILVVLYWVLCFNFNLLQSTRFQHLVLPGSMAVVNLCISIVAN